MADDKDNSAPMQADSFRDADEGQEHLFREIESMLEEVDSTQEDLCDAASEVRRTHWKIGRVPVESRQWPRQLAISIAVAAALVYLWFRILFTLNLASPATTCFSAILLAAETYGLFHLALYFYQVWRLVEPPLLDAPLWHSVDVFVTTYNEDVSLLRNTLLACVEMDYPHTTYVLDDGAREEVRRLAKGLGVEYIARTTHEHAKAGNVNNALRQTDGEFVIILDADHVPHVHMITRILGYFQDSTLGFVQAPHTTYNLDNFLGRWKAGSRLYWEDVRIFYEAVQLGKNRHGVACFCGSAAMFRRKALEDIGLFATETITEDLHTGMRINAAGWKSLAVSEDLIVGLAPEDPETFCGQRLRWGEGNLSVLAHDNPLTMKGLRPAGRINYLASILNWTYGPVRLVLYLVPLVMLFTGILPVVGLSYAYGAVVAFYLISVWTAVKAASNRCGRLLGIELAMMSSFHLHIRAIWRALFRRRFQKFVVTAKRRKKTTSGLWLMWPQLAIVVLGVLAVTWAALRVGLGLSQDYAGLMIGGLLASYHAWLGLTVLRQATRRRDPQAQWRNPMQLVVRYRAGAGEGRGVSLSFNEDGLSLLAPERLSPDGPIDISIESPFSDARCVGGLVGTEEIAQGKHRMYIHEIAFRNPEPAARQTEKDEIARLSFGYVIPWILAEHQEHRNWLGRVDGRPVTGHWTPFPVDVTSAVSAIEDQSSVVERMSSREVFVTLAYPLPEGTTASLSIRGPQENLNGDARVAEIHSVRVGVTIVHRHRFEWIAPAPPALADTLQWLRQHGRRCHKSVASKPKRPLVTPKRAGWAAAAACLVLMTGGLFWLTHRDEFLMLAATKRPLTPTEEVRLKQIVETGLQSRRESPDRLLKMYEASVATGDFQQAAELATRLAEKVPEERTRWLMTSAMHFVHERQYEEADGILRKLIASGADRSLPIRERAELFLEAARVALAVGDLERSVSLFTHAGDLRTFSQEEINEYVGLLVSAGDLERAAVLLRQLEASDAVLRRIVDVFEIAGEPEAAVPELEVLHARNPEDTKVLRRLAELAVLSDKPAAAVKYYRELLKLRPDDSRIRRTFAGILATEGKTAEAIRLLRGQSDTESRLLLISLLETDGQFNKALAELREIRDKAVVNSLDYRKQLVRLLVATRRYDEALAELHRISDKSIVDSFDYRKQLIALLLATRQYNKAVVRCNEYLRLYPGDRTLRRDFINALASCDLDQFSRTGAGTRDTGSEEMPLPSMDSLRRTLLGIYREYKAAGLAELTPTELTQLADLLRRFELPSDGIDVLKVVVEKCPKCRVTRLKLAEMLSVEGRFDEAEKQYVTLLRNVR